MSSSRHPAQASDTNKRGEVSFPKKSGRETGLRYDENGFEVPFSQDDATSDFKKTKKASEKSEPEAGDSGAVKNKETGLPSESDERDRSTSSPQVRVPLEDKSPTTGDKSRFAKNSTGHLKRQSIGKERRNKCNETPSKILHSNKKSYKKTQFNAPGNGGRGGSGGGEGGGGGGSGGAGFHKRGGIGRAGRDDDGDYQPSIDWQNLPFKTQYVQHSCYCSKMVCERLLCSEMKKELLHYKDKYAEGCGRCQRITNLLKLHAATCQRSGCRVPNCSSLRRMKCVPQQQVLRKDSSNVYNQPQSVDGKVIYSNLEFIPFGSVFQESIDYHKGQFLSNGTNGNVYAVNFRPGCELNKKSLVVKETNYKLNMDELDVYKSMGKHANIVEHHCVTFKGNEFRMCIFMERCDKSLKDVCDVHKMDTKESMFYWTQVLAAVDHLHDKGIIHKDIKAKNVLLLKLPGENEYCRAKLADFDFAKKLPEAGITQIGLKPMGTLGFVAPEVLEKKPHGRPADIYSMGCLLLELNGITPKLELLPQQVEQLCKKEPCLGELVRWCVQDDYRKRPTAKEIMNYEFIQAFMKIPVIPDEV